ncbi:hypothetical protein [Mycobacterium asiaticum]|nr:hypothetical protein [Mycobacterium asiaticum]
MAWEKVKLIYEMPRGGHVEVTDNTIVPIGEDAFTHRQLTYTHEGCEIVFEVHNRAPGAVSIRLWSDGKHLRTKDLAAIKLDQLRDEAYLAVGLIMPDPDGGYEVTHPVARRTLQRATSRRKITPEFLALVAEIHQKAPAGGRTRAITEAFDVTDSQAFRYIAAARKEGLIND